MTIGLLLIAVIVVSGAMGALAQGRSPYQTVKIFYEFSIARPSVFNRQHIEARKRWYTHDLYRLFLEELQEQEANLKAHPTDKPFFGDGLDFEPLHELCQAGGRSHAYTRRIGKASVEGKSAYVDVTFSYPQACNIPADVWRVKLEKVGGRWLLADWIYSDGSSLVGDMKASHP